MSTQENTEKNTQNPSSDEEKNATELPAIPQLPEEQIAGLTAEVESLNAKLVETHDRMLRIAADADNTRKRLEKEKQDARAYSVQAFAFDLLPVIDSFEKALQTTEKIDTNGNHESLQVASMAEGVKLVSKIFNDAIKKHGIERIPGTGSPFNPAFHNAIAKETDSSKYTSEIVVEEFMAGYKIRDRVLRTALVKVGAPD